MKKAREYYDFIMSYPQTVEGLTEAIGIVVDGLNTEAKELIEKRHAVRDSAVIAILREQNNKWNAISALFEKNHGYSPMKRNSFLQHWGKLIPELLEVEK